MIDVSSFYNCTYLVAFESKSVEPLWERWGVSALLLLWQDIDLQDWLIELIYKTPSS